MINLCTPAIIYIIFSLTQIIIDTINGMYNTAFIKTIIMIIITFLLQILCQSGLNVVSWIIVFIPFIFMTVITSIVLYVFGLNAATGTINIPSNVPSSVSTDASGNIIVYDPYYDPFYDPVYYKSPNLIIPRPPTSSEQQNNSSSDEIYIYPYPNPLEYTLPTNNVPNSASSSPAYQ
jgi:hypothetical protein